MATAPMTTRPAIQKVRLAEDGWNSRDPGRVALGYAMNSRWRNQSEFVNGRDEIIAFLFRKWARELDYRLIKELWAFTPNRIAVRFAAATRLVLELAQVLDIALDSGFGDVSNFNHAFRAEFGVSPRAYRKNSRLSTRGT